MTADNFDSLIHACYNNNSDSDKQKYIMVYTYFADIDAQEDQTNFTAIYNHQSFYEAARYCTTQRLLNISATDDSNKAKSYGLLIGNGTDDDLLNHMEKTLSGIATPSVAEITDRAIISDPNGSGEVYLTAD